VKLAIVAQPLDVVPGGGSLSIWAQELADRLSKRHEVTIFSGLHEGQAPEEQNDGVSHVRMPTTRDEAASRLLRGVGRRLGRETSLFYRYYFGWPYYRSYAASIARRIAHESFDAAVVINFSQFLPVLRRRNPTARIALMMQCDWLVELERRPTLRRLRAADAICGCSNHIAEGVARRFPELAERCYTILNASNPERFVESDGMRKRADALRAKLGIEGQTVILFVGRVCPEKGVHVLVEAMHRVRQQRDDTVLLVAGAFSQQPPSPLWLRHRDEQFGAFEALKPNYRNHLEEKARGIEDRVHFLGKVPHEDLPDYYGLADIFVHPAIWQEPFGMILTEAMGCGLPVISTRSGGIPEVVVDGETGLLARAGDPETLADAILDLAGDPARRKEMGRRGAERLRENFTWERAARRMETVLLAGESRAFAAASAVPENSARLTGESDE
jgi:glycosyltransferase involved in cell wall biosynthesis